MNPRPEYQPDVVGAAGQENLEGKMTSTVELLQKAVQSIRSLSRKHNGARPEDATVNSQTQHTIHGLAGEIRQLANSVNYELGILHESLGSFGESAKPAPAYR